MPRDDYEGRAFAGEQQDAYLAALKRELAGYEQRGDRNDKAHDMTYAERAAEVQAEIDRVETEIEGGGPALSTLGRPEGPGGEEGSPNPEATTTEPPARQAPTRRGERSRRRQ